MRFNMSLARLRRIPERVRDDLKIIRLVKNWHEILSAKLAGRKISMIQLRNGVVFNAPDAVDLDFLFHEIWIHEFYAPAGYEIGPNQTVVDIGGNIGVFAMYAATKAPGVTVLAFEPFPQNAEFFAANREASGADRVNLSSVAVAADRGSRTLRVEDAWILHSLVDRDSEATGLTVESIPLDDIIADLPACHLLKLDCEGGEYEILYSASDRSLAKIARIVCEFNVLDFDRRNGYALCDFLRKKGFEIDDIKMLGPSSGFISARQK